MPRPRNIQAAAPDRRCLLVQQAAQVGQQAQQQEHRHQQVHALDHQHHAGKLDRIDQPDRRGQRGRDPQARIARVVAAKPGAQDAQHQQVDQYAAQQVDAQVHQVERERVVRPGGFLQQEAEHGHGPAGESLGCER